MVVGVKTEDSLSVEVWLQWWSKRWWMLIPPAVLGALWASWAWVQFDPAPSYTATQRIMLLSPYAQVSMMAEKVPGILVPLMSPAELYLPVIDAGTLPEGNYRVVATAGTEEAALATLANSLETTRAHLAVQVEQLQPYINNLLAKGVDPLSFERIGQVVELELAVVSTDISEFDVPAAFLWRTILSVALVFLGGALVATREWRGGQSTSATPTS